MLFSEKQPTALSSYNLLAATEANKERAKSFLDKQRSSGHSNAEIAIKRAFTFKPDVIVLISDGEFNPQIVEELARLRRRTKATIHTVAVVLQPGRAVLEQMARQTGGFFVYIDEQEAKKLSRIGKGLKPQKPAPPAQNEPAVQKPKRLPATRTRALMAVNSTRFLRSAKQGEVRLFAQGPDGGGDQRIYQITGRHPKVDLLYRLEFMPADGRMQRLPRGHEILADIVVDELDLDGPVPLIHGRILKYKSASEQKDK